MNRSSADYPRLMRAALLLQLRVKLHGKWLLVSFTWATKASLAFRWPHSCRLVSSCI